MSPALQVSETPAVVAPPPDFVPTAVRSAGSEADRIQAEYIASLAPVDPNAPPVPVVDPQVPVDPQALPSAVTSQGNEELPPPAPPGSPDAKWEHSYKSLSGRFKAQQAKDQKMIADLTAELTARRAAPPLPSQSAQFSGSVDDDFTEEELETWGPDLTATIARIAEAKANKALQTVAPVVSATAENIAIERETSMRNWLNTQIDFEAVNVSDDFKTWLHLRDPMSGAIRQELLETAWLSIDGPRVLAICNGFLAENPGSTGTQPVTAPPAPPAQQAPRQPSVSLESLAAPGRARVQTPVTPSPQRPIYTRADVKAFYDAKNRGFYRGKEAEAAGYEAEIILAGTENRII